MDRINFYNFRNLLHWPTYKTVDCNNEEIKGTFYEQELQKATQGTIQN